jgi:hypothetical protein
VKYEIHESSDYQNLIGLIRDRSCVPFIGSGLSAGLYPSWNDLIKTLCEECDVGNLGTEENLSSEDLLKKADEAKANDVVAYNRTLGELFTPSVHKREAYELLLRLKFRFYITTNFDPLLAEETRKEGRIRM